MELRRTLAPWAGILPSAVRSRLLDELWQKQQIDVQVRNREGAFTVRSRPLPHIELFFEVTNRLPVPLQVHGASVEIWLGKPIVSFYCFLSEQLRPGERRESFRAYTFINQFQAELLNPPKKESLPPNVTINLTIAGRSRLGLLEKTVKAPWLAPEVLP